MDSHLIRGQQLFSVRRWTNALDSFRESLSSDPECAAAHCGAALALLELGRAEEAEKHARAGVAALPEHPACHYVLARTLADQNRPQEALKAIDAALELEPEEAKYWGLKALLLCDESDWAGALRCADLGLAEDPTYSTCLVARARAMIGLGQPDETDSVLKDALSRNAEDPLIHASLGWTALAAKQHERALEHFSEALKIDPELEWAREGMMESLRNRYFIYRWIFRYYLRMSRLTSGQRWMVILGGYFAVRFFLSLGRSQPDLKPWLLPFLLLYALFVYLSWTGQALANVFLRWNKHGSRLLNSDELHVSALVSTCWVLAGGAFLAEFFGANGLGLAGLMLMIQVIPICARSGCSKPNSRKKLSILSWIVGLLGLSGFTLMMVSSQGAGACLALYFLAVLVTSVAANVYISRG